jgi:hypothetical protein
MQITVSLIVDIPASADIDEIESLVQAAGRQAMCEAVQKAVRASEEEKKTCPHCGREQRRTEGTKRRVIQTRFGRIDLSVRQMRCQGCGRRYRPVEAFWPV